MTKRVTEKDAALNAHEKEILDAYESGKLKPGIVSSRLVAAARETLKKNRNINIRISENDLEAIKLIAAREGLPYQSLIGSLIHKYACGTLSERS